MKSFRDHLKEKNLTYDEAKKIFGISGSISSDELKKKYKQLAIQNHPDKGGSVAKMQDVNQAFEMLSKYGSSSSYGSRGDWTPPSRDQQQRDFEERKKRREHENKQFQSYIMPLVNKYLNTQGYVSYLEGIFDQKFNAHVSSGADRGMYGHGAVWYKSIFVSEDKEHYVTIETSFFRPFEGGLSSSETDFNFNMNVLILSGTKKLKLAQRTYTSKSDLAVLGKPEVVLPKDKFAKQLAKRDNLKFTKKDALLFLKSKLNASYQGSGGQVWAYIPLKDGEYTLSIYRISMMRQALWSIANINGKTKEDRGQYPVAGISFSETPENFINLASGIKAIQDSGLKGKALADFVAKKFDHLHYKHKL